MSVFDMAANTWRNTTAADQLIAFLREIATRDPSEVGRLVMGSLDYVEQDVLPQLAGLFFESMGLVAGTAQRSMMEDALASNARRNRPVIRLGADRQLGPTTMGAAHATLLHICQSQIENGLWNQPPGDVERIDFDGQQFNVVSSDEAMNTPTQPNSEWRSVGEGVYQRTEWVPFGRTHVQWDSGVGVPLSDPHDIGPVSNAMADRLEALFEEQISEQNQQWEAIQPLLIANGIDPETVVCISPENVAFVHNEAEDTITPVPLHEIRTDELPDAPPDDVQTERTVSVDDLDDLFSEIEGLVKEGEDGN